MTDDIPPFCLMTAEERKASWAAFDAARQEAEVKPAGPKEEQLRNLRQQQDDSRRAKSRGRIEKLKAKLAGATTKMPAQGKDALAVIAAQSTIATPPTTSASQETTMAFENETTTAATAHAATKLATKKKPATKKAVAKKKAAGKKGAAKAQGKPAKSPKSSPAPKSPKTGSSAPRAAAGERNRYDWKGAEERARAGKLPRALDFSAACHSPYVAKKAEIERLAQDGDTAGLKKLEIPTYNASCKSMSRWRDLAVTALSHKGS